jgi:DNA-binding response OmpR family regulator
VTQRLLVVDDDAATRLSITAGLSGDGYEVDCAARVDEALSLLATRRYAAVITDLQLTPAQGAEGLAVVREAGRQCPAPRVVVLTGSASPDAEAAARKLGADAFFAKPKTLESLRREVRSLVAAARPTGDATT